MSLQLEQNEACQYDAISVMDTNETQLHKLCGQNQENIEVTSSGNLLTLEIKSDSVQEGSGFLASWEEVDEAPSSKVCEDLRAWTQTKTRQRTSSQYQKSYLDLGF